MQATRTLQASVVGLYGVVLLLRRWVRVGCARLLYGHEGSSSWSGLRGVRPPAGPFLYLTTFILLYTSTFVYEYAIMFS